MNVAIFLVAVFFDSAVELEYIKFSPESWRSCSDFSIRLQGAQRVNSGLSGLHSHLASVLVAQGFYSPAIRPAFFRILLESISSGNEESEKY
jgi:hypothetical protein